MKHGLAIIYHEWGDPIFTTTVLPFLKALKARQDIEHVYVMTFESQAFREGKRASLFWMPQKKFTGPFLIIRKVLDTLRAYWRCRKLKKLDYIIAAGTLSGTIAAIFSALFRVPLMVLTFEPHADYMVDAKQWKKSQLKTIILRFFERYMGNTAQTLFATTQGKFAELREGQRQLLPSCVDLDQFQFNPTARNQIRDRLKISAEAILFVYLGKFGELYFEEVFFEQMAKLLKQIPSSQLLIISHSSHQQINSWLETYQIADRTHVTALAHDQVASYLSAADIGITGIPSKPSMRYRSPIKDGEYWACGLPVLISKGVGDDYLLARKYDVGVVIGDDDAWVETVPEIFALLEQPRNALRQRCRRVAQTYRSLQAGIQIIKKLNIP